MTKIIFNGENYFCHDEGLTEEVMNKALSTINSHGKEYIVLPKNNTANRGYVGVEVFEKLSAEQNTANEAVVPVRTTEKRVLGSNGYGKKITMPAFAKYFGEDSDELAQLEALIANAQARYDEEHPFVEKAAKVSSAKTPEDKIEAILASLSPEAKAAFIAKLQEQEEEA